MNARGPLQAVGSAVGATSFLNWWLGELEQVLTRPGGRAVAWAILVTREGDDLKLYVRRRGRIEAIDLPADAGAVPSREAAALRKLGHPPEQIVLRLKPHEVVQTTLSLPRSERQDIEAIIRNQIEFLAPWPADRVLFDFLAMPQASDDERMAPVQVVMTGRDLVDELQRRLATIGLKAGVVDSGTEILPEPSINLLRIAAVAAKRPSRILLASMVAVALAALVVAGVGSARLLQSYTELRGLETRIQSVRGAAEEAQRLAREGAELKARSERLASRKLAEPAAMIVIEVLSRSLPDDTWLSGIELRGRDVRITGKSPNAAALIGLLEGSRGFTKVRFAAPTTREAGQDIDTFAIVAEIAKSLELVQ